MLGTEPIASTAWRRAHDAAVVAAHDDARRRRRGRWPIARAPFSSLHAALEEVVLEHGRDLGVLAGQHLLAAHDERHLRPERREHVDELDAGDARADHGDAAREAPCGG